MAKRTFTNSGGETWEWEETEETRKAVENLHKRIKENPESQAPDYGVGK